MLKRLKPLPKRQVLSEAEWLVGELVCMPSEGGYGIFYAKQTHQFSLVNHIRLCCLIDECETMEEASSGAEMMDAGLRLPPDERPARKWPGVKR